MLSKETCFSAVVNISGGFIHQVSEEKAKVGTKFDQG